MSVRLTSRTIELRRVVVTGMGTVNPLGGDVGASWNAALKGESGIRPIDRFEVDDMPVRFAGQVVGFDPADVFEKKEVRRLDRFLHLAMGAAVEAVADSGLDMGAESSERVGVMVGSGIAGLQGLYDNCTALADRGPSKVSPFFVPTVIANMASGLISIRYGARGPNSCVVTACTTGTHNLGDALPADPARGRGRDDRRRDRGAGQPHRPGGFLQHEGPVAAQRRLRPRQPPVRQGPRRLRAGRGAPGSWCWRAWNTLWPAAPASTPRSSATACLGTLTT